jgi:hypothetical protein
LAIAAGKNWGRLAKLPRTQDQELRKVFDGIKANAVEFGEDLMKVMQTDDVLFAKHDGAFQADVVRTTLPSLTKMFAKYHGDDGYAYLIISEAWNLRNVATAAKAKDVVNEIDQTLLEWRKLTTEPAQLKWIEQVAEEGPVINGSRIVEP